MGKKKVLVVGCSGTSGYQLGTDKDGQKFDVPSHPSIWCHRLFDSLGGYEVQNESSTGANNETIFHIALENILSQKFDLVLIQWTKIKRLNLQVGLELYHTRSYLKDSYDINLNNYLTISGKWLDDLGERLQWLSNPHWHILNLVRYVNVLKHLQNFLNQGKIFFVNGSFLVPKNFFTPTVYQTPSELPELLQDMLKIETRDDNEIRQLYEMIHSHYSKNQGIQPDLWLNLYEPLTSIQVDGVTENDDHPGPRSQIIFADFLKEKLRDKLI